MSITVQPLPAASNLTNFRMDSGQMRSFLTSRHVCRPGMAAELFPLGQRRCHFRTASSSWGNPLFAVLVALVEAGKDHLSPGPNRSDIFRIRRRSSLPLLELDQETVAYLLDKQAGVACSGPPSSRAHIRPIQLSSKSTEKQTILQGIGQRNRHFPRNGWYHNTR